MGIFNKKKKNIDKKQNTQIDIQKILKKILML